jgi:hypothetical protein
MSVTHLRHPKGGAFCGLEGHQIIASDDGLAGWQRLEEVDCVQCFDAAMNWATDESERYFALGVGLRQYRKSVVYR